MCAGVCFSSTLEDDADAIVVFVFVGVGRDGVGRRRMRRVSGPTEVRSEAHVEGRFQGCMKVRSEGPSEAPSEVPSEDHVEGGFQGRVKARVKSRVPSEDHVESGFQGRVKARVKSRVKSRVKTTSRAGFRAA